MPADRHTTRRGPHRRSGPTPLDAALRALVEAADDLLTVVDEEGRLLYVNPAGERVFGLPPAECVGLSAFDFVHPEDRETTIAAFRLWTETAPARSFSFENRQVSRSGAVHRLLWTVTRQEADGKAILVSSARDLTALREVQDELGRSELRLRSLVDGLLDPVVTIDPHGTVLDANAAVERVFGWEPRELLGQNVKFLMPEPHRSRHDEYLANYRRTGETWILGTTREFEVVKKSGETFWCALSVSRIDVPGREEPLFSGSFRDITDRVRAEQALAESERRFRAIFEQEYQFVGLLAPDGTVLEANTTSLESAGTTRDEVLGKPFWDTPWWAHSEEARGRLRDAVARAALGEFVRFTTTHGSRDGAMLTIDFSIKPLLDEEGRVVLLIPEGRDVTELERARQRETTMLRALATIGESASILAHEIKNPITAVNAALRAVAKQLGEEEQEVLRDLVERMQKLERLMRRTLSLAKPIQPRLREVEPRELLTSVARHLGPHAAESGVALEVEVDSGAPRLRVDPELVEDVLTNLVRNALEALDSSGPVGRVRISARPSRGGGLLAVEDSGPGIPSSLAESLFKPFVTTKASGTGIGLALARKVVEAHGGEILAGASPDLGGARFALRLPAAGGDVRNESGPATT